MPRKYQDQDGIWWYEFKNGTRTRCNLRVCALCGREFPTYRASRFCSRACFGNGSIPRFTGEEEQQVIALYQSGTTVRGIADTIAANEATIFKVLTRHGIPARRTGGPERILSSEEQEMILRGYWNGESLRVLANALGTHEAKVSVFLRSKGIDTTKRRRKVERLYRKDGYRDVWDDARGRYVREHRKVMEDMLGRPLEDSETVHHINAQKDDNSPENLQLRQGKHGKGAQFRCMDCGSHNIAGAPI